MSNFNATKENPKTGQTKGTGVYDQKQEWVFNPEIPATQKKKEERAVKALMALGMSEEDARKASQKGRPEGQQSTILRMLTGNRDIKRHVPLLLQVVGCGKGIPVTTLVAFFRAIPMIAEILETGGTQLPLNEQDAVDLIELEEAISGMEKS